MKAPKSTPPLGPSLLLEPAFPGERSLRGEWPAAEPEDGFARDGDWTWPRIEPCSFLEPLTGRAVEDGAGAVEPTAPPPVLPARLPWPLMRADAAFALSLASRNTRGGPDGGVVASSSSMACSAADVSRPEKVTGFGGLTLSVLLAAGGFTMIRLVPGWLGASLAAGAALRGEAWGHLSATWGQATEEVTAARIG